MQLKHLNQKELARRWSISHRTLERWRWAGEGPQFMKLGGRVVYRMEGLCCTNDVRDSLFESSGVATVHEQLVPYEVQDQELAFVQYGAEAARFAISLV